MYNDLARYAGEAMPSFMQQTGNKRNKTETKPVLIGFANLRHIIDNEEIRKQSRSISTVDLQVRCALFA